MDRTRHRRGGHRVVVGSGPTGCAGGVSSRNHSSPACRHRHADKGMLAPVSEWAGEPVTYRPTDECCVVPAHQVPNALAPHAVPRGTTDGRHSGGHPCRRPAAPAPDKPRPAPAPRATAFSAGQAACGTRSSMGPSERDPEHGPAGTSRGRISPHLSVDARSSLSAEAAPIQAAIACQQACFHGSISLTQ